MEVHGQQPSLDLSRNFQKQVMQSVSGTSLASLGGVRVISKGELIITRCVIRVLVRELQRETIVSTLRSVSPDLCMYPEGTNKCAIVFIASSTCNSVNWTNIRL
jgi:hypothetical protein